MIKELPQDWKWVKLGEVCKLKNGFAFKSTDYINEGIPVIRISDIKSGSVKPDKSVRVSSKKDYEEYIVTENEILVAMSGATTGKFGIFRSKEKAYQNQRVGKFQIHNKMNLDNEFLLYQLHALKRQIEKDAYGGAQPNISSAKIEAMEILLPPLPTQQAIVAKIEELFSELNKGIEQLKTAQQQLKTYRQAVLKWAFEGKLTSLNHDSFDLVDEYDLNTNNQGNPDNHTNHRSDKSELPKGWKWVKLKEIAKDISDGDHQAPPKSNTGVPFITISNVNKENNKINFSDTFSVSEEYFKKLKINRKPLKGDVLYTVTGSFGIPILIDFEKDFCFQRHIGLVRPLETTNQKWLYYLLQSPDVFNQAKSTATGTAQKTVALNSLRNFEVPYCKIEEQHQIVQAIESRLSVADKLEESIAQSLQQSEALRQSILKKAFKGRLV